ncbi:MAG TPA: hotdog fold domain-containing protein [Gemmatimonadaceae bacterium]|nr:hotdog fold domain-containing protein [Gemmatimonadaceae bacterium]
MSDDDAAPGARLLAHWRRWHRLPGGQRVFAWLVGRRARYTGTVGARIVELRPGFARAIMRDRPRVRNHLRSIHAVALVNLAEVVSGLAMLTALPPGARGIVTGLSIAYLKKARGTLSADSTVDIPPLGGSTALEVCSVVRDAAGDEVARATVRWLVRLPGEPGA